MPVRESVPFSNSVLTRELTTLRVFDIANQVLTSHSPFTLLSLKQSISLVCKKLRSLHKQNNTWLLVDMKFLFSLSTRFITRSLHSLGKYWVEYEINVLSTSSHLLFSISLHLVESPTRIFQQ